MSLVVQKFGGTSVADSEKILAAARKAIRAQQSGHQVVMVVSAMGKNTDLLMKLAGEVSERPPARELDMLLSTGEQVSVALMAMAIDSLGYKAISLTGAQCGIKTDSSHTKARIRSINTDAILRWLDNGYIVIAAGFQGIDEDFNITTLGRGGSDTTAVALAAVLHAETCEIYTDVDGVYTTDPRILPEARIMSHVSYDEMLELASLGAGVMHSRSIEFAKKFDVAIHVRSSLSDNPGSLIVRDPEVEGVAVSGAALTKDEARITLHNLPDNPGTSFAIFSSLAKQKVTVDMIVQNLAAKGEADLSFTVPRDELDTTIQAIDPVIAELGGRIASVDDNVSKVSVVGLGMAKQTGIAYQMFQCLADNETNIQMITTSEIKISTLIQRDNALESLRAVHNEFSLDVKPESILIPSIERSEPAAKSHAIEVISRLQGVDMEKITINDIVLDETQGQIALNYVPNRLGIAAGFFKQLTEQNVFIDMIILSYGDGFRSNLSITVSRDQVPLAEEIGKKFVSKFENSTLTSKPEIAKLTVSGIGLRSHTGVAIKMFEALFKNNINVDLINTSEVRVNVVVDSRKGQLALQTIQKAFSEAKDVHH